MQHRISKVWVDDSHVWAETTDGLKANYAFSDWKRLAKATPEQRRSFSLSRFGIHWSEIDEDLNFWGMFTDTGILTDTEQEDSIFYQT